MTHQAKRPYGGSQPSITSYFSPSSSSPSHSLSLSNPPPYNGSSPPLPANVQSNLLSVGMRVRKSVPEGYKTGSYAFNNLLSDPSSQCTNFSSPSMQNSTQSIQSATSRPKTRPRAGNRELTPFCGILNVGGMAQQSWEVYNSASSSSPETMAEPEEYDNDDMPFLSSQGSTISNHSIDYSPPSNINSQKRRFFEDDEEIKNGILNGMSEGGALGERVMAMPRRKKWSGKIPDMAMVEQENLGSSSIGMGMGSGMGQDGDFEEADFLVRDDHDLEMSG